MATSPKKKDGSESTSRTKVVGVRLDPKLRYLTELAARKQRRSLSSFIEWAIEESLSRVILTDDTRKGTGFEESVADEAEHLWDVDEADRFAKLALKYPAMLTHEEQVIWKLVRENGYLWRGKYTDNKWTWSVNEQDLVFERLREHWNTFVAVARGDAPPDALPKWDKQNAIPAKGGFGPDIPF